MKLFTQPLIIGSTGKTGSRVMHLLEKQGYQPKGAARSGDVYFDWNEPATWAKALKDIDSVYLTYYPDLAIEKAPDDIARFCALAKMRGVKHITLLSGRGEPAAQVCENIVKGSGLSWTIVRAAWFNQNFSEGLFKQFILSGHIALPVDETPEPFVDIDDIAEVVVASLTCSEHNGKLYEVTGPERLSFRQLAAQFSTELNRPITFEQIPLSDFQTQLKAVNVDAGAIEALTYLFTEVLDGRNDYLTNGVQQALGREPKRFAQYISDNKAFFGEVS